MIKTKIKCNLLAIIYTLETIFLAFNNYWVANNQYDSDLNIPIESFNLGKSKVTMQLPNFSDCLISAACAEAELNILADANPVDQFTNLQL
ncbi:MAG: hypothetical protein ABIV51_11065 [Saprospiraceae bacterium]